MEEYLQILEKYKTELMVRKERISGEQELLEVLSKAILKILRNNHSRMFNILYKHDISEQKAAEAFKQINDEDIANSLAILLIDREKMRIAIRKKYSEGGSFNI